jgi:hypothetical protein
MRKNRKKDENSIEEYFSDKLVIFTFKNNLANLLKMLLTLLFLNQASIIYTQYR